MFLISLLPEQFPLAFISESVYINIMYSLQMAKSFGQFLEENRSHVYNYALPCFSKHELLKTTSVRLL